jgi:hypothetical protein
MFSGSFGIGVSANDELLLKVKLDLDLGARPLACLIPGAATFADQTLEAEFLSPAQKFFNVFCE